MSVKNGALGEHLALGHGVHAYTQPDGSWWINNAGFVVGPDAVTLIDTAATERRTRPLLDTVARVAGPVPIRTIVNTHHHGDHSFGNSLVPEAVVLGHHNARHDMVSFGDPPELTSWTRIDWGEVRCRPPELTFESGVTLWHADLTCEIRHVGRTAHTRGDVIVWIPDADVLFAGDLLFNGGTPFVLSGSIAGLRSALEDTVRRMAPRTIVPGHGPVCGLEVVEQTQAYLELVSKAAADGYARGESPLELAGRLRLGEFADWLDAERIVTNLHRAYTEVPGSRFTVDEAQAFADMLAFHGGTLPTHA
ncbi:MBL fold metallo-hydrolase [Saccharopolyspora sp. ASAGF58]|uniref:MBL fold metallo-hydrolase n=1 Tax=Saccharopolyspora sp. ASAGF58 TaxID=2719023 RepID=UPI00143FF9A6|nr:MBL fold metallo-hydrolase [Saccharopolyspora sp. ASAGF58]QIZ38564.1 MBL fold metallo-hydrolase [Saccharopolyspora sp. ASAGF58]